MVVYVDKTGSNTNQKSNNGHFGGQRFIDGGVDQQEFGPTGSMADNHFTVLVFTAATGEPIMVAVILKSKKTRDKMPSNWMLGLDYLKIKGVDLSDAMAVNDVDLFKDQKEAMCGGPTCTFQLRERNTMPC